MEELFGCLITSLIELVMDGLIGSLLRSLCFPPSMSMYGSSCYESERASEQSRQAGR